MPRLQHVDVDLADDDDPNPAMQPLNEASGSIAGAPGTSPSGLTGSQPLGSRRPKSYISAPLPNALNYFHRPADDSCLQSSPGQHPGDRITVWTDRSGQVRVCYEDGDGNV